MKKLFIICIFIFVSECSSNKNQLNNKFSDILFSDEMSFLEFKKKLNEYADNNPYPNIND